MKINNLHPGANHYYIHAVEASKNSKRAMASADRLGKLMPGVSHMIHMPSHIYIRNGEYSKGITVNEMSVKGYDNYMTIYPDVQKNVGLYLVHNLHMQTNCAMMEANYSYSNKSALATRNSFDSSYQSMPAPGGTYMQYLYMTPTINNVRFGKWDVILNDPPVNEQYVYSSTLWHWARGMAFAGKNNFTEAENELKIVKEKMKSPDMLLVMAPYNAPADAANVGAKILEGIIAAKQHDFTKAIRLLKEGVVNEDKMIYNEPKDWLLPAREYLGTVLLQSGKASKAADIFEEDLKENPNNHWSLYGLYQALQKQKKTAAAKVIKNKFDIAFENTDIKPGIVLF
jgi:tetratricopeptide (TPR) repeat protein